jgi:hypothetical protein
MNVTYNWWGTANDAEIMQRVFDFDDWNTYMLADYSPFFVTEEIFLDFWWKPSIVSATVPAMQYPDLQGQPGIIVIPEPNALDLKGRMYESKTLTLLKEKWYEFPYYYRPFRPYRIIKDLTIMPGATLTIERGVELHIWPNVRILVLGHIKAEGTYWEPIRFKPINTTELAEIRGLAGTRYRRSTLYRTRSRRAHDVHRFQDFLRKRERRSTDR